jgi:hypothetical protein
VSLRPHLPRLEVCASPRGPHSQRAPTHPQPLPDWAWELDRWQSGPAANVGPRPQAPKPLPAWYPRWQAWHHQTVKVTVS